MNRKELTKTVMMISNLKNLFGLQGFHKKISAERVKVAPTAQQCYKRPPYVYVVQQRRLSDSHLMSAWLSFLFLTLRTLMSTTVDILRFY